MRGTVLITGAAGRIGTALRQAWKGRFRMRLLDRLPIEGEENAIVADLTDFPALLKAMEGVEVVVHLAADARGEAPWEELLPNNLIGTYHVFEAARRAGVRRVIFASTVQVIFGYPAEEFVTADMPPRTQNLYGVSKVFGETLGRFYAEVHGLSVICVRIGGFATDWPMGNETFRWCLFSARDAAQLFGKAVEAEGIGYAIFFGTSDTPVRHLDIEPARRLLGYQPEDSPDRPPL